MNKGQEKLLDAIVQLGIDRDVITWDVIPYYVPGKHWSSWVRAGTQWWGEFTIADGSRYEYIEVEAES